MAHVDYKEHDQRTQWGKSSAALILQSQEQQCTVPTGEIRNGFFNCSWAGKNLFYLLNAHASGARLWKGKVLHKIGTIAFKTEQCEWSYCSMWWIFQTTHHVTVKPTGVKRSERQPLILLSRSIQFLGCDGNFPLADKNACEVSFHGQR